MTDYPVIYPLFSSPVYFVNDTGIRVNDNLLNKLANTDEIPGLGPECGLSKDVDVLNTYPELSEVKDVCNYHLQQYVNQICGYSQQFYITTSWLSRNKTGIHHQPHSHPNSILSGCLYLRSSPDNKLLFHGDPHFKKHWPLTYSTTQFNIYNSESWWVPVNTGTIVIWPSNVLHSASENKLDDVRVALCFNTFIKGKIGGGADYASDLEF